MKGITKAISKLGSPSILAERLGTSRQVVEQWRAKGVVPAQWVLKVYDATKVPVYELNPVVFPKGRIEVVR